QMVNCRVNVPGGLGLLAEGNVILDNTTVQANDAVFLEGNGFGEAQWMITGSQLIADDTAFGVGVEDIESGLHTVTNSVLRGKTAAAIGANQALTASASQLVGAVKLDSDGGSATCSHVIDGNFATLPANCGAQITRVTGAGTLARPAL